MAELRRRNIESGAEGADETAQLLTNDQQQNDKPRPTLTTAESSDHVSV